MRFDTASDILAAHAPKAYAIIRGCSDYPRGDAAAKLRRLVSGDADHWEQIRPDVAKSLRAIADELSRRVNRGSACS